MEVTRIRELTHTLPHSTLHLLNSRNGSYPNKGIDTDILHLNGTRLVYVEMEVTRIRELTHSVAGFPFSSRSL